MLRAKKCQLCLAHIAGYFSNSASLHFFADYNFQVAANNYMRLLVPSIAKPMDYDYVD